MEIKGYWWLFDAFSQTISCLPKLVPTQMMTSPYLREQIIYLQFESQSHDTSQESSLVLYEASPEKNIEPSMKCLRDIDLDNDRVHRAAATSSSSPSERYSALNHNL
jgi:hypothetical protein